MSICPLLPIIASLQMVDKLSLVMARRQQQLERLQTFNKQPGAWSDLICGAGVGAGVCWWSGDTVQDIQGYTPSILLHLTPGHAS